MDGSQTRHGEQPLRVLFVCTANIARSPYAELRAAMLLSDHAVHLGSAGVRARGGHPMDEAMAAELCARGGSGQEHVSQPVDDTVMASNGLIIALTYSHHMDLLQRGPQHADRIVGLRQLARAMPELPPVLGRDALAEMRRALPAASMTFDVADPYKRGKKAAARCASEIDEALAAIAPFLARVSGAEYRALASDGVESGKSAEKSTKRRFPWTRGANGPIGD